MKKMFMFMFMFMLAVLGGCAATTTVSGTTEETETETEFRFYLLREDGTDYGKPIMQSQSPKVEYAISDGCVQKVEDGVVVRSWVIPELRKDAIIYELIGSNLLAVQNGQEVWLIASDEPQLITSMGRIVTYSIYDEKVTAVLEEGEDGKLYLSTLGLSFHDRFVEVVDKEGILEPSILDSFVENDVFVKNGERYRLQISAHRPRADSPWGLLEYSFSAIKEQP